VNEEKKSYVYVLVHQEQGSVFYVGRGTLHHNQYDRFPEHVRKAKAGSELYVHRKMRKLWQEGQHVVWELRGDELSYEESLERERRLIAYIGLDTLTNITPGGDDHPLAEGVSEEKKREFRQRISDGMVNHKKYTYLKHIKTGEVTTFASVKSAAEYLSVSANAVCQAKKLHSICNNHLVSEDINHFKEKSRTLSYSNWRHGEAILHPEVKIRRDRYKAKVNGLDDLY